MLSRGNIDKKLTKKNQAQRKPLKNSKRMEKNLLCCMQFGSVNCCCCCCCDLCRLHANYGQGEGGRGGIGSKDGQNGWVRGKARERGQAVHHHYWQLNQSNDDDWRRLPIEFLAKLMSSVRQAATGNKKRGPPPFTTPFPHHPFEQLISHSAQFWSRCCCGYSSRLLVGWLCFFN